MNIEYDTEYNEGWKTTLVNISPGLAVLDEY